MTELEYKFSLALQHANEDKELYKTIKKQLTKSENQKVIKENLEKTAYKKTIFTE